MEHIVEARGVDSRHLKLEKPIKIKPGSIVLITIEEPTKTIAEDEEWYLLSMSAPRHISLHLNLTN